MSWERELGMEEYLTDLECSGRIKELPEDFVVEEEGPLGRARVVELFGGRGEKEPRGGGEYLYVVLEKRDWDLNDVLKRVARGLHVSRDRISFAGTKDKYAVTAQWISLWRVKWDEVRNLKIKDVAFHTPIYGRKKLRRGDLLGNWFKVRVRGCEVEEVPPQFINYFGHQRFGSYRFVSHLVGKYLLVEDYEAAVRTYLTVSSPWEPEETREARRRLTEDFNPTEALSYFPKRLRKERAILSALATGKDYRRALFTLPKNLIALFIHAYQSYLFNRIASALVREEILEGETIVPGYLTRFSEGRKGEVEREVVQEEGVDLSTFRRWKKFGTQGDRRKIVETAREVTLKNNVISFFLPKGTYATSFLRELLKPSSPVGFVFSARKVRERG